MEPKQRSTRVPANREQWSESSKRSLAYDFQSAEYSDLHYLCWRCGTPSVFLAEEQKKAYEIRKAYIWQRRFLCDQCWRERRALEKITRTSSAQWKTEKRTLQRDRKFVVEWKNALEELPKYGARKNGAIIAMLNRLLGIPVS